MTQLLVRAVTLRAESGPVDLRARDGAVVQVGEHLERAPGELVVEARGGRLLPTLADDHLHIGAWTRAMRSRPFPVIGLDADTCRSIESDGPNARGWTVLFGIDHQHDIARTLAHLDRRVTHAVLVVHRTGHLAVANRIGRQTLDAWGLTLDDVGAAWRAALGPAEDATLDRLLARLRDLLLAAGVAEVQDTTPYASRMNGHVQRIAVALWPIRASFMGSPLDPLDRATHLKLFDPIVPANRDRPLAVHAVEPAEVSWACEHVGTAGRIEHASICPEPIVEMVSDTGCKVCANPGFFMERTEALAPILETGDAGFYQPLAELLDAGVRVTFGSDAPVGEPGPWPGIEGAQRRGRGTTRFPGRALEFDEAIRCAVSRPGLVGASADDWLGGRADFVILHDDPSSQASPCTVAATVIDGNLTYTRCGGREYPAR